MPTPSSTGSTTPTWRLNTSGSAPRRGLRPGRRSRPRASTPPPTGRFASLHRPLVFERDGRRLDAGGWQTALSYDVIVANLDPSIAVTPPPASPEPFLERFGDGLTTAEVATLLAEGPDYVPDIRAAEHALSELVDSGGAQRVAVGNDAVWLSPDAERPVFADSAAAATLRSRRRSQGVFLEPTPDRSE